jgi:hypothetical protein
MRIRITYKINGEDKLEEGQITNFPRDLWGKMVHASGHSGDAQSPMFFYTFHIICAVFVFHSFKWGTSMVQATGTTILIKVEVCLVASHYTFWCFLFFLTYFMYISTKYSCRNQILPFEAPSIVSCWEHFRCLIFFPICSSWFGCFRSVLKVVWCLIRILEFHNCYIIFILCNIFPSRSNPKIISGNSNLILSFSLLCFLLYFWLLNWKKIFPVTKSLIYL